jgi:hypothetical protein
MASTQTCLWCRNTLLRHVRRSGVYWFCNSCRQEIHPLLVHLEQVQRVGMPVPSTPDFVGVKLPLTVSAAEELEALPVLETEPDHAALQSS